MDTKVVLLLQALLKNFKYEVSLLQMNLELSNELNYHAYNMVLGYLVAFNIVIYQTPLRLHPPPSAPPQERRERSSKVQA